MLAPKSFHSHARKRQSFSGHSFEMNKLNEAMWLIMGMPLLQYSYSLPEKKVKHFILLKLDGWPSENPYQIPTNPFAFILRCGGWHQSKYEYSHSLPTRPIRKQSNSTQHCHRLKLQQHCNNAAPSDQIEYSDKSMNLNNQYSIVLNAAVFKSNQNYLMTREKATTSKMETKSACFQTKILLEWKKIEWEYRMRTADNRTKKRKILGIFNEKTKINKNEKAKNWRIWTQIGPNSIYLMHMFLHSEPVLVADVDATVSPFIVVSTFGWIE